MAGTFEEDDIQAKSTNPVTKHMTLSELRSVAQNHLLTIEAENSAEAQSQIQTEADLQKYTKTRRRNQPRSASPNQAALITSVPEPITGAAFDSQSEMAKGPKLRSASDVLGRLRWDPSIKLDEYHIGYLERFEGIMEMPARNWIRESTDEDFIPQHRIRWVKRKLASGEEEVVWDRDGRIDHIFGSGRTQDLSGVNQADLESVVDSVDGGVHI